MRRTWKITFASGLAGAAITGALAWREIFVHQSSVVNPISMVYGAFALLTVGAIIALRKREWRA